MLVAVHHLPRRPSCVTRRIFLCQLSARLARWSRWLERPAAASAPLAEIREEWSARMPSSPESVSLQLPGGTPVLDLTRIVYDTTGRAVEVMLAVIAADTVQMSYRFPIPD
ncbi:MAG: UTRA domain-containing protein [Pseudonocardiaceae bacterium]